MQSDTIHHHDLVVIGGGLAGLRAALEAVRAGLDVAVVSKVHPLRSHSVAAQGGVNAALANNPAGQDDTWEKHAFDTVKGADFLADWDAVEILCREARAAVVELEHMGAAFSRMPDGRIAQRPFGGAGFPRTCYCADRTGQVLLHTLYEQAVGQSGRLGFYDEFFVTRLVVADGRCAGCVALDIADGTLHGFAARAVLLATGGYGRLYSRSTNALICTGDGAALAFRAGVPLKDMEFVQFHPTTLLGTNILISEAARGEGGVLLNNRRERFMRQYAQQAMELAPRDIVARAIQREVNAGRGFDNEYVQLDLRGLGAEKINARLPGIRQIALDFAGVDPVSTPLPVQPGQHYSMGGVACDRDGATALTGLFAAGEAACVSVHGANRLGGNSLLETVVFGRRAGQAIARQVGATPIPPDRPVELAQAEELADIESRLSRPRGERVSLIRDDLKMMMQEMFGVFREEGQMKEGLNILENLKHRCQGAGIFNRGSTYNQVLVRARELENMVLVAEAVARSALDRRESRGAHARTDFPNRDDAQYLSHTMAWLRQGEVTIAYQPVAPSPYPAQERSY
jgi:succinate dehydrogenase / fumarate reductase flavoprotein subunit